MMSQQHSRALTRLARLFAAILVAIPLTQLSAYAAQVGPAAGLRHNRPAVSAGQTDGPSQSVARWQRYAERHTGPIQVMLELNGDPAARTLAAARGRVPMAQAQNLAQAQAARIDAAQRQLLAPLAQLQARVLYRVQHVYNGVAVTVDASKLAQLRQLPGVQALHVLVPKKPALTTSVPFIGAPQLWNPSGANVTGQGIKIGIIDSGVDYIHEDLGGSGKASDYARNDTTTAADNDNYPNKRVVGGIDLVGDNYNADGTITETIPHPDDDPAPCYPPPYGPGGDSADHGTHVAGIAAGNGVAADGSAYTGPYNSSLPFSTFKVGPGVAPQAQIYSIRVFGCNGSTNEVVPALEWAVDHHLDVVNLSLGSNFGSADDPDAVASDNAVLAGVAVVESAGNAGDTFYDVGTPSTSSRAISVASSVDSGKFYIAVRENSPSSATYEAVPAAFGPSVPSSGITSDVVYALPHDGCSALTNATAVSGHIALIDRGTCTFKTKVLNAQNAGATAVVVANNQPGPPITMGDDPTITATITIPAVMIRQADGAALEAQLAGGAAVNLTVSSGIHISRGDTLSTFSARGPRSDDSALKPDIAAPGDSITSAQNGSGNGSLVLSGTSMAAPHVSGGMALLRQLHPDWTVAELKALLMDTATHDLTFDASDPRKLGPGRVGAGRIDLTQAASDSVLAYNADHPELVSLSFGAPEVVGSATLSKNIFVLNKGAVAATYDVAYAPAATVPGVSYNLPSSVSVASHGAATIPVTLQADAAKMTHTHDQTVFEAQNGLPRAWLSESAGYVTLTPRGGGPTLRVAVYAAPRPASQMSATSHTLDLSSGATTNASITLQGLGVDTTGSAPLPQGEASLVTALELQQVSPAIVGETAMSATGDLKDIGVTSNITPSGSVSSTNTEMYIGVSTYRPWTTPNRVEFDVDFDVNGDGVPDYTLFNDNFSQATGGSAADPSDTFVTVLVNLSAQTASLEDFVDGVSADQADTVPFNTDMMVLPVFTADLGLTPGHSAIRYRVTSFVEGAGAVDSSDWLSYDPGHPGLDLTSGSGSGLPIYDDQPGTTIPLTYNRDAYAADHSLGVLLLHHHNTADNHDEVITIKPASVPSGTTTPELGSGELLATGLVPILAALLYRRRRTRRAGPAQDTGDKEGTLA